MHSWSWHPSLYAGSAAHYATGRMAYPPELAAAIATELGLDGTGTLLDVGCGPGSLTLLLAPKFARAITFAQSIHWMDRPRVAAAARRLVAPGGALVHVRASRQSR